MKKLICKKCGKPGYSASEETRCSCGSECENTENHSPKDQKNYYKSEIIDIFLKRFLTL